MEEQAEAKPAKKAVKPPMEKEAPVEAVSIEDMLKLENSTLKQEILKLRAQNAELNATILRHEDAELQKSIRAKYSLGDKDRIDASSHKILRG